jgi:hypothetical protein
MISVSFQTVLIRDGCFYTTFVKKSFRTFYQQYLEYFLVKVTKQRYLFYIEAGAFSKSGKIIKQ